MTSSPPAADLAVLAAYQQQTQALRDRLQQYITALWNSLGQYRAAEQAEFVRQVVPVVAAGQRQMSALTLGYLAAQRTAVLGRSLPIRVDSATVTGAAARNGVDPAEVYRRPFNLVWRQLHELPHVDGAVDQAIAAGMDRAVQTAFTDLQLTKVQTSQRAVAQDGTVTGYRRVLEGPHSCALCIVAATLRYHRDALLPVHPGCDCTVEPLRDRSKSLNVTAAVRVGDRVVNLADLPEVHQRIEERFGASSSAARVIPGARDAESKLIRYRDVLITHEHGELGPVLAVKGRPFLGPDDI